MNLPGMNSQWEQAKKQVTLSKLAGLGMLGVGDVHIIKSLEDADGPRFQEQFGPRSSIFSTFAQVEDRLRASAHDYVLVWPKIDASAYAVAVDWTYDFLHVIGVKQGNTRPYLYQLDMDGDGIEVAGMFIQGFTASTALYSLQLGTACQGAYIHDCLILPPLQASATSDVIDAGKRTLYEDCVFGQTSSHVPNTIVAQAAGALTGRFERCTFLHKAAAITDTFAVMIASSGINVFRDCVFHNANAGTTDMTLGVTAVATGEAFFDHCSMSGADIMATTALSYVAPSGCALAVLASDAFNPGLAVNGAVPIAVDT